VAKLREAAPSSIDLSRMEDIVMIITM